MKLYEIPKDSNIRLTIEGVGREAKEEVCTFKHVDGMYSLILTPDGEAVHLNRQAELTYRQAELTLVDGIYELV